MPAPTRPNPYAPKPEHLSRRGMGGRYASSGKRILATRMSRFLAHMLDGLIPFPISVVAIFLVLGAGDVGFWIGLAIMILGGLIFTVLQVIFLVRNAATIGKMSMGIYIADVATGKPADWVQTLMLRTLAWGVLLAIPGVGQILSLMDIIYFFREDRRCLHDLFAKTVVYQR